jgi:hypothetical protein
MGFDSNFRLGGDVEDDIQEGCSKREVEERDRSECRSRVANNWEYDRVCFAVQTRMGRGQVNSNMADCMAAAQSVVTADERIDRLPSP